MTLVAYIFFILIFFFLQRSDVHWRKFKNLVLWNVIPNKQWDAGVDLVKIVFYVIGRGNSD